MLITSVRVEKNPRNDEVRLPDKVPGVSSEVGPWFFSSRDHWRIQEYGGMQRIRTHTRVASGRRKQDPIQTHSFPLCRALRNNFFDAKTKRAVI